MHAQLPCCEVDCGLFKLNFEFLCLESKLRQMLQTK